MEGLVRISSPVSESWVAWLLLFVLILWGSCRMFLPELSVVLRGMFSRSDRSYVDTSAQTRYVAWVYKVVVVALIVQLVMSVGGESFLFADYVRIVGIVALLLVVQWLLIHMVGMVFLPRRQYDNAIELRSLVQNALCGLLPVVVMVGMWQKAGLSMTLVVMVMIIYLCLLLWKGIQMFYNNLLSVVYILLYIISLECVPVVFAMLWIKALV